MTPKQYQEIENLVKDIAVSKNGKVVIDFMKHIIDTVNELGAGIRENDIKDEFWKSVAYLLRYHKQLGWRYISLAGEFFKCKR